MEINAARIASTLNIVWPFNCWFRRTQFIPLFGRFYKNVGILLGECLTVKN